MSQRTENPLRRLTWAALLVAIDIIAARFLYFYTPGNIDRISLQFIPNALSGLLFGPAWGALTCVAGDMLGMFINPSGMSFNPLITLSAGVRGVLYGLLLYKKDASFRRVLLAVGMVTLVVDLGLNPVWLSIMYGKAWLVVLWAKIPVRLLTVPAYAGVLFAVVRGLANAGIPGRESPKLK